MRVKFNRDYDHEESFGRTIAFKEGYEGVVTGEIGKAARDAGAAVEVVEAVDASPGKRITVKDGDGA